MCVFLAFLFPVFNLQRSSHYPHCDALSGDFLINSGRERGGMKRTREKEWERGRGGESGELRITRELMRRLNTE